MKTITVYRFNPYVIYRGGGFPFDHDYGTEWDEDIKIAEDAYHNFHLYAIDKEELKTMQDSNKGCPMDEKVWILSEVQAATITEKEWKDAQASDYFISESVGNAADWDFKTHLEQSFMPTGAAVPKKLFSTIYGKPA